MTGKAQTFEERLDQLEALVRKMEGGSLPLDETLAAYEAGMQLAKALSEELDGAEKRKLELSAGQVKPMEDAP